MRSFFRFILKFYKNLSIKKKLLIMLYIQIAIPIILIGFMSYVISSDIILRKSEAYSQDILGFMQLRLKDYDQNIKMLSDDLRYDLRIYDVLSSHVKVLDPINKYENKSYLDGILKRYAQSKPEVIQAISFTSLFNDKVYKHDNYKGKKSIEDIAPYAEITLKAREEKGRDIWYLDIYENKVKNIYLARTIYDLDTFAEIGLMTIMINKEYIERIYKDIESDSLRNVAVLSEDNKLILSRNKNDEFFYQLDFSNKTNPWIEKKSDVLVSYANVGHPPWRVVTYISLKELNREISILRNWILFLSILCVVILSVLGIFMAVDLLNPINRLVKGMDTIRNNDSDVQVIVDRNDELGFLGEAFNDMAKEINHLLNGIYREQITRKDAEIKALQSQINPHFLFNTLESINWMAQLNSVPEISNMVSDLSSLMEASIGRDDKLITVEEEFNYTEKYISLLKRRFGDRILFKKTIQKEVLDVLIPRLLIQPLIENAVYHGIDKNRKNGRIGLEAQAVEECLIIVVSDNGPGIKKEELVELNQRLQMDNKTYFKNLSNKSKKSIGVENVNRRIKLFYGENYGLKIESEEGVYTEVIVKVPLKNAQNREGYYVQGANS